jgi:tetratricopeptide (TPR) repeat protein
MYFRKVIVFIGLLFSTLFPTYSQNKILQNKEVFELLRLGSQKMHNYDFDEARTLFKQAQTLMPEHPAPILMQGILTYWTHLPLSANYTNEIILMESQLHKAAKLAQAMQDKEKNSDEGVFFEMTARSLLMQHYAKLGLHTKALGEARSLYSQVKQGMKMKERFNEFYFTSGIYNYYREAYPEAKPIYKPFAWIFQSGDKELGLQQLVYAGKNCVITQTQAWSFLTNIYLTYENNPYKSVEYSKELVTRFPKNRFFLCRYVETLLLTKQYNLATPLVKQLVASTSPETFTLMIPQVFEGILAEKHLKNYKEAKLHYEKVLVSAAKYGVVGNQYQAYAYLGLSRIAKLENQPQNAKNYRKKAEDLAEYKYIFMFE